LVYVHAGLLACAPRDHDWVRWDEHFSFIQEALTKNKIVDRDLAYCAHLAADNAAAAGQRVSAGEAYRLALDQFKALGNDEKVSEVSASWATVSI